MKEKSSREFQLSTGHVLRKELLRAVGKPTFKYIYIYISFVFALFLFFIYIYKFCTWLILVF